MTISAKIKRLLKQKKEIEDNSAQVWGDPDPFDRVESYREEVVELIEEIKMELDLDSNIFD